MPPKKQLGKGPISLRIPAHSTPHSSDPSNADEFYTALGMFVVAWGRFEGHMAGVLLQILALPEVLAWEQPLPISWKKRAELWRDAFNKVPALAPHKDRALAYITRVMNEI